MLKLIKKLLFNFLGFKIVPYSNIITKNGEEILKEDGYLIIYSDNSNNYIIG